MTMFASGQTMREECLCSVIHGKTGKHKNSLAASRQMCGIIVVEGEVEEQSVKQWRKRKGIEPEEAGQERRGREKKAGMSVCMVNNLWGVNLHKKRSLRDMRRHVVCATRWLVNCLQTSSTAKLYKR